MVKLSPSHTSCLLQAGHWYLCRLLMCVCWFLGRLVMGALPALHRAVLFECMFIDVLYTVLYIIYGVSPLMCVMVHHVHECILHTS